GLVNNDPASVVSGAASLTTTATVSSGVGTYPIAAAQGTLAAANYAFAFVDGTLTVGQDNTTTSTIATVFGQSVTFTATVIADAPGSGTPTGSVDFFDTTTNDDLGSAPVLGGAATLTAPALPAASQTILVKYLGDANFTASSTAASVSPLASIYVLNATLGGALALSGNASIQVPGVVVDDSSSSTAAVANGNAGVKAAEIDVVGGARASGHATFDPAPLTGHAAVPDPLRNIAAPSGGTSLGAISLAGNSSLTIHPGVYARISVSGKAQLTMTSGVYVIAGGGFAVSGNASVNGAKVMIYNAGGNYLGGDGFGPIHLSGNGQIGLTAPTTGPYAGLVIFQSRDNVQGLLLSGNAMEGISGTIYAANALATLSGNAFLNVPLVVNSLALSGNAAIDDLATPPLSSTSDLG
ncbi:MAG: Ig-like domain repeat protein, partial [Candidatus Saccharimonadales bacterium]